MRIAPRIALGLALAACARGQQPIEPTSVAEPLNLDGNYSRPLWLSSQRGFSWTATRYLLGGVDTTDPYQPGRMLTPVDVAAASEVTVRQGPDLEDSRAYGSDVAALPEPFSTSWHGTLATSGTAGAMAWRNLLPASERGLLRQSRYQHWLTRDHAQAGGPLGHRVHLDFSASGQWASETVPQTPPGSDLNTRQLFFNAGAQVTLSPHDLIRGRWHWSRAQLSDWGEPAGIEAFYGRRLAPSVAQVAGFSGEPEDDRSRLSDVRWTHAMPGASLEASLAWTAAHLDTAASGPESTIDLVSGAVSGAAPLANRAERERTALHAGYARSHLRLSAEWQQSNARNQFSTPNATLLTAAGIPRFRVVWETPQASRQTLEDFSLAARYELVVSRWLTLGLNAVLDRVWGGPIAWNSLSPRVGLALTPPWMKRLVLRASYARLYAPLAARYLDFADPSSLSGRQHLYGGPLVAVFGGAYSSIDPAIRRPHADEINVKAELSLPGRLRAGLWLFRRDEKNRIALADTGVTAADFRPMIVHDPGPDGSAGTFDDQKLTVYAQSPASFGQDRYLLANPRGLRTLNEGLVAQAGQTWPRVWWHASLMAVKSSGPANPGSAAIQNDPGVLGALFLDPNLALNATGRSYFDRAYVGKLQFTARLPIGLEWASTVNYLDGLAFARVLLVTDLPQGPIVVDATRRGSPGGGNRAEHVLMWNMRTSRLLPVPRGAVRLALDMVNVTNAANRIEEITATGVTFNQRLPAAIQPARFLRLGAEWRF